MTHARNGCSELSIPAGQKDRRFWGREWTERGKKKESQNLNPGYTAWVIIDNPLCMYEYCSPCFEKVLIQNLL